MTSARKPDRAAILIVVALCAMWAHQQIAVKLALPDLPALTQGAIRAGLATLLVFLYAWRATPNLFARDGALWPGVLAGLLFGLEFVMIFVALTMTTAGRVTLFLYTAPFFLAAGLAVLTPHERMSIRQWAGLALSFAGVALAFGGANGQGASLAGDLTALAAGATWGATTLVIKATPLRAAPPVKTLLYQLAVSTPVLAAAAWARGETILAAPGALALASLAYQTVLVGCVSYLAWFMLIARYRAGDLSAVTFLTPVFGALFGWALLGEALTPGFALAVALVAAGIALVNWPARG